MKEQTLEEKQTMDVETSRTYQQMYMLAPQRNPEPEQDPNPAGIKTHYGKS